MSKKLLYSIFSLLFVVMPLKADDWWWDKMEYLIYTPKYFGPNAFPIPELMAADLPTRWEVEVRGEFHKMTGDKTKDVFARAYIPIVKGKAGIAISGVYQEWYETSPEVRDERSAVEVESPIPCHGDIIVNCYYQILRNKKWADIVISANIKTASGGRVCDARYTDAASYWFDANIGRTVWSVPSAGFALRLQALAGFYCWMTNDDRNRQNDAICYGVGARATWKSFLLDADFSGFSGYRGEGDKPMVIRTKLEYELKKNIISFRYKHGVRDYLYDSYSIAYIRCF